MRTTSALTLRLCILFALSIAQPLVAQTVDGAEATGEAGVHAPAQAMAPVPADSASASLLRLQDLPITARLRGQLQLRFIGVAVDGGSNTGNFRIPRARLAVDGSAYEDFDYQLQLELGGPGGQTSLIDANVRYQFAPIATLWMGRGKAPFGREQLTSSRDLNFVDRSIVDERFAVRRQQGVSLRGSNEGETFEYNAGVYNRPPALSGSGNPFMAVARVVWTPFGAYSPVQSAHEAPDSPRLALGISGVSAPEADVGERDFRRMNVEFAYLDRGINMTGEFFREWLEVLPGSTLPDATTNGFLFQLGYLFDGREHELAGRLAQVDRRTLETRTTEYGIAHSYYLRQHRLKLQTDLRYLTGDLVSVPDEIVLRTQLQIAF